MSTIKIISILSILLTMSGCTKDENSSKIKENDITYSFDYKASPYYLPTHTILELKHKGYSNSSIETMINSFGIQQMIVFSQQDFSKELNDWISLKDFKYDSLNQYVDYKKNHSNYTQSKVILCVNIGCKEEVVEKPSENGFYQNIQPVTNLQDLAVLVNKNLKLPSNYVPSDLVTIPSQYTTKSNKVKSIALNAFIQMADDLKSLGYKGIKVSSAYRSYSYQSDLYSNYVNKNGVTKADTFSARPGHSEHQLGLAIDYVSVTNPTLNAVGSSKEYQWIKKHAHEYGFIIRYPKEKVNITGYIFEPWHIRYVGIDLATELYTSNKTLDEYYSAQ